MVLRGGALGPGKPSPARGPGGVREARGVVRWLRANLVAAGVDVFFLTIYEALDAMMVLGATMRALPLEDFEKAQKGSRVSSAQANSVAVMNLVQRGFLGTSPELKQRMKL